MKERLNTLINLALGKAKADHHRAVDLADFALAGFKRLSDASPILQATLVAALSDWLEGMGEELVVGYSESIAEGVCESIGSVPGLQEALLVELRR